MKRLYVGMDLGSKSITAAVRDARGKLIEEDEFPTSERQLLAFINGLNARAHVLIEEGELAGWVYRTLLAHVEEIEVAEPRRNAYIHKGPKGDTLDARKLAEIRYLGAYSPVIHAPDEDMAAFQVVVKHYDQVSRRTAALKSQIKARLRTQGVICRGTEVYGPKGRLKALERVPHPDARRAIELEFELLDLQEREKAKALSLMRKTSARFPVIRAFMEIPGCGLTSACRFAAAVHTPDRFSSRSPFWRYCRLGILVRESGGVKISPDKLDQSGNGALKNVSRTIFNGARRSGNPNGIKRFFEASKARTGKDTNARLNTQRKILWTMLQMWKNGEAYSDDRFLGA